MFWEYTCAIDLSVEYLARKCVSICGGQKRRRVMLSWSKTLWNKIMNGRFLGFCESQHQPETTTKTTTSIRRKGRRPRRQTKAIKLSQRRNIALAPRFASSTHRRGERSFREPPVVRQLQEMSGCLPALWIHVVRDSIVSQNYNYTGYNSILPQSCATGRTQATDKNCTNSTQAISYNYKQKQLDTYYYYY